MRKLACCLALVSALLLAAPLAFAHAVLVASTPAANATLHGPSISIALKFNSRVDGSRSRLFLASPGGASIPVQDLKQTSPDRLTAHAHAKPGKYELRWQALSDDGHVTRGSIPFTVQ